MIIGVTGSLGTGTSTAARYIAKILTAKLIDADKVARSQISKNTSLVKRIVSNFGKEILDKEGNIDRTKLADKAFANRYSHKKLCGIIYPVIIAEIDSIKEKIYKQGISDFVIDGPVLIESGFYKECDLLVVVTSSLPLQLERAWTKKKIRHKDALSRIRLQMPLHKKRRYADYIIDNNATLAKLRQKCIEITGEFKIKKIRRR
jgi:dephospho-CoA kinase